MARRVDVGLISACLGVLATSFLPWGVITGGKVTEVNGAPPSDGSLASAIAPFFSSLALPISGWSASSGILGLSLPVWLAIAAVLLIGVIQILNALPNASTPPILTRVLSCYAVVHTSLLLVGPLSGHGSLSVGYFMTLGLMLVVACMTFRSVKMPDSPAGNELGTVAPV
jgi:hypothetical protein